MLEVVLLTLAEQGEACSGSGCAADCGTRTPVLACRDALRAAGASVTTVVAHSDDEIDEVLAQLPQRRVVFASASDAQLRAVARRLLRRYAPAPSKRPADLPSDRTVPDLPPLGLLPLGPDHHDLATRLGLPRTPSDVASAVLGGHVRRLDLLRTDAGSVTLDGALLGGDGHTWRARVEVDDAVLSDGTEPLLVTVVANADRYATVDGLPLVTGADCADGVLDVAVALPRVRRRLLRPAAVEVEVRRASGRAVAITPRGDVPFADDTVTGTLTRKRSWWMERAAWAVYATP